MQQETLRKLYIAEMALGVLSMILGALITALVWRQGYYVGALMLVVTGLLSFFLAWREYRGWEGSRTQRTCIEQMAEREGVTEQLKAENQIEWVGRLNALREAATEIVNTEVIFV